MRRKGISPLIAVVMLIAFTLLVAGILGAMVIQFSQQQRAEIQYCTGAKALLLSGAAVPGATGKDLILNIHNFGDVDLTFSVLASYRNGTVQKIGSNVVVESAEVAQYVHPGVDLETAEEFTIQAEECQGVQDLIRSEDIRVT